MARHTHISSPAATIRDVVLRFRVVEHVEFAVLECRLYDRDIVVCNGAPQVPGQAKVVSFSRTEFGILW
jgi:hypothetical protein